MNIYEMLEEHLPKERNRLQQSCRFNSDEYICGFNVGINAVFDVLKRAEIDDFKIIEILDEENLGFSNDYICDLADNISQTNILRIDDEKTNNKSDPTEEEILNIIEGELMKELSNEVMTCERFEYPVFKKVAKAIYKRITEGAE